RARRARPGPGEWRWSLVMPWGGPSSVEPQAALREAVERPPPQAVVQDDEQRHAGGAEHEARTIRPGRRHRDILTSTATPRGGVAARETDSATMLACQAPPEAVMAPVT